MEIPWANPPPPFDPCNISPFIKPSLTPNTQSIKKNYENPTSTTPISQNSLNHEFLESNVFNQLPPITTQTQPNTWDLNAFMNNRTETLIQQLDRKLKADMQAIAERIFAPSSTDLDEEIITLSPAATSGSAIDGTKLSITPYQPNNTAMLPKAPTEIPFTRQTPAEQPAEIEISFFPYTNPDFPD